MLSRLCCHSILRTTFHLSNCIIISIPSLFFHLSILSASTARIEKGRPERPTRQLTQFKIFQPDCSFVENNFCCSCHSAVVDQANQHFCQLRQLERPLGRSRDKNANKTKSLASLERLLVYRVQGMLQNQIRGRNLSCSLMIFLYKSHLLRMKFGMINERQVAWKWSELW